MEYLVVDSGAIIRGYGTNFHLLAKRFVTVDEVLSELRDIKSRELLAALPFEIESRLPSEVAMRTVAEFARKSGDFAALSATDLKLIALTYTLESEINGVAHLRKEPAMLQTRHSGLKGSPKAQAPPRAASSPMSGNSFAIESSGVRGASGVEDSLFQSIRDEGNDTEGILDADDDGEGESASESESEVSDEGVKVEDTTTTLHTADADADADAVAHKDSATVSEGLGGKIADGNVRFEEHSDAAEDVGSSALNSVEFDTASFTDFPSLTGDEADCTATIAPVAFTWAKVASTNQHPQKCFVKKQSWSTPTQHPISTKQTEATTSSLTSSQNEKKALSMEVRSSSKHEEGALPSRILSGGGSSSAAASKKAALEDDGVGWINSHNFRNSVSSGEGLLGSNTILAATLSVAVSVGCITTDFSMQNVMMQLGLNVVSVDGRVIQSVRQWVLRCMACYKVHYDMDRLFCSKCGANHMSRVAASIDSTTGKLRLHLRKNYVVNTRGTKYSLPKPGQQGRFSGELLLREDQLKTGIWRQKVVKMRKDVLSAFGEDVTSDVGLHINKSAAIKIGLGSRNPNADRGRERRGKKKK